MSEAEPIEPIGDPINRGMSGHWTVEEVDQKQVLRWLEQWQRGLVWQQFLKWKRIIGIPDDLTSIEVGCGYGKFSMLLGLSGANTILLDYNGSALKAAMAMHQSLLLQPEGIEGDLLELADEFRNRFDLVCSFGTLEHFEGDYRQRTFQACTDLLRPGGLHFFTVPHRAGFLYRLMFGLRRRLGLVEKDFFEKPYSIVELRRLAQRSGVEVLELAGGGTLKSDWSWWVMENVRSTIRKLRHAPRPELPPPSIKDYHHLDLLQEQPDPRTWLDRRFSSNLLFVGRKPV